LLESTTQPAWTLPVQTVGLNTEPVITIGITILPDIALDELEPGAMLILPGGEAWDAGKKT